MSTPNERILGSVNRSVNVDLFEKQVNCVCDLLDDYGREFQFRFSIPVTPTPLWVYTKDGIQTVTVRIWKYQYNQGIDIYSPGLCFRDDQLNYWRELCLGLKDDVYAAINKERFKDV